MAASRSMSSASLTYSALMHALILILIVFGLPSFFHRQIDPEPQAISVDILPISPISNIKPQEKPPEKVEEKKPEAEQKTEKKAVPEAHKEEPAKPKEDVVPLPVKQPVVVKKEEKKPEKKKEAKVDDLDSILKSVKNSAKAEAAKKPSTEEAKEPSEHAAKSDHYDASLPLSMSEKDAIRSQIQKCWDVPAGAKDAYNLAVTLHIDLAQDGSVTTVELAGDKGRYASDSFFRAAADSAIRAVKRCSPLQSLPPDKYGSWHDMEMTFDPKDMLF